jgi:myo-inositol-1-phosphate synthase
MPNPSLAVLLPGLGAISTTLIAGVFLARRGLAEPLGALTQALELEELASLQDLEFVGWDIFEEDALQAARTAGVLSAAHLDAVADELSAVKPLPALFRKEYVPTLDGTHRITGNLLQCADQIRADIRQAKSRAGRAVMILANSTELQPRLGTVHQSEAAFLEGLEQDHPDISPSMIYAWAAAREGVPVANCTPNVAAEIPAIAGSIPTAGKDLKTGQTLIGSALAPMFAHRRLAVDGWFSTNLLGNRDGFVLNDPGAFAAKRTTKSAAIEQILEDPALFGDMQRGIAIHYHRPHGDRKEGWDAIDFRGWLGYPMHIRINLMARDSILAAPLMLDLALLLDLAARRGREGAQPWLGAYFKHPLGTGRPVHDFHLQQAALRAQIDAWR